MTLYVDNFGSDLGWAAAGGHVDSTGAIANGALTVTAVGGEAESLWTRTGFVGQDVLVVARTSTSAGDPQVHVRETDEENYLAVSIDSSGGNFTLRKNAMGLTTLATAAITDFSTANDYYIVAKVFGNALHGLLFDDQGRELLHLVEISSDISDQTGTLAGVGASGAAVYSDVVLRSANLFTTVVCLGDSNTDGNNIAQADEFPQQINKRYMTEPVVCVEAGKAGDNIAECEARVATEVAPYDVAGHRNVCILQMGTNDRADGFTAAQSWTRYQSCIATVKAAGFEAFVGTGFPNTKDDAANTQWNEDLNADILADEATYGYTAVDIWTAYGGTLGSGFPPDVDLLWVSTNNPHASEEGHIIFANTYMDAVHRNRRLPAVTRGSAVTRGAAVTRGTLAQPRLTLS